MQLGFKNVDKINGIHCYYHLDVLNNQKCHSKHHLAFLDKAFV